MVLAPIVLFVYNRPDHTRQTVEALQANELANESELFIYSDESKNNDARKNVDEVRDYIDNLEGFKKVTVIKREKNWGLADSIVNGVSEIINEYGKVIVLEDDLVTGKYFLRYMNESLEMYFSDDNVWQITGYNYEINTEFTDNTFFFRGVSCWSWATWKHNWDQYNSDIDHFESVFSKKDKKEFNFNNSTNIWNQIELNKQNKIKTWCVFFYASMFENKGLCLYPRDTLVKNIGHDDSGVHCRTSNEYDKQIISNEICIVDKLKVQECPQTFKKIEQYFLNKKKSIFQRITSKLVRIING